jgi:ubiquinone/menaquinone biosynthesis C-methylase UbiE
VDAHRAQLIDFALDLARSQLGAEEALRVLDAGCGSGALFARAQAQALPWAITGLEADGEALALAARRGFPVLRASAETLPFATASFDLVILRHVLHHLKDPKRALMEAARVARRAVLVAEPFFDQEDPRQARSLVLEIWSRRVEWCAGRHHDLGHSETALRAMMPSTLRVVSRGICRSDSTRDALAFAAEFVPLLDDSAASADLRRDLDQILAEGATMTRPGSTALLAIK